MSDVRPAATRQPRVRVEVLGPLRLLVAGAAVAVPGPKRRVVLALLALAEGRTVTVDALVDALWPSSPPDDARQALHSHVSRLRGHLGPAADRLETRPDGYRLALGPGELDLAEARAALRAARAAGADETGARRAVDDLARAEALWRGPVLADLTDVAPVAAAVVECAHLRDDVRDALARALVRQGRAAEAVPVARAAVAVDPLREPGVRLLVEALAAAGRAAEALDVAREHRARLADEAGLDPSPALAELERAVAAGDLAPTPAPSPATAATPAAEPAGAPTASPAPVAPDRLIGRAPEVAALHRALAQDRLVTVVGPGGVGKTSVALEVARRSRDVTLVPLAPVTDPAALPYALAAALGLTVTRGDVLRACLAHLAERHGLLVLDCCEHVLDAAREVVGAVLAGCPHVSVLATSRERLGLASEYVFHLPPLTLPGAGDPGAAPSVELFLDRARRVRRLPAPDDAELRTVAEIVRRLDGMPLAIELAAGRLSTFALTDLLDRLDRSLDLLGGPAPSGDPRHRTLRATVAWSYDLLDDDARRLFRHLSPWVDGADLATAEAVAADVAPAADPGTLLARLVDTSMLTVTFGPTGTRYRMLDTLRAYGADRLAAEGDEAEAADRLVRWGARLAERLGRDLRSEREAEADAVLRAELATLRAAFGLARGRGPLDAAITLVSGLHDAITYRDLVELRAWAAELADDAAALGSPRATAVLAAAAEAAYHEGRHARAAELARAGLDRAAPDDPARAACLLTLSVSELATGAWADAAAHALEAAAGPTPAHECFGIAALATLYAGDVDGARRLAVRAPRAGSPGLRAWDAYVAGEIENVLGELDAAERHYRAAIDAAGRCGATFIAGVAAVGLLTVLSAAGRVPEALHGYREVVDAFARTGNWTHLWATLRNLARLLRELGEAAAADLLEAAADAAPDAPATGPRPPGVPEAVAGREQWPDRAAVLRVARDAVGRCLELAGDAGLPGR